MINQRYIDSKQYADELALEMELNCKLITSQYEYSLDQNQLAGPEPISGQAILGNRRHLGTRWNTTRDANFLQSTTIGSHFELNAHVVHPVSVIDWQ